MEINLEHSGVFDKALLQDAIKGFSLVVKDIDFFGVSDFERKTNRDGVSRMNVVDKGVCYAYNVCHTYQKEGAAYRISFTLLVETTGKKIDIGSGITLPILRNMILAVFNDSELLVKKGTKEMIGMRVKEYFKGTSLVIKE